MDILAQIHNDVISEFVLFSLDALLSVVLLKAYSKTCKYISCLQEASLSNNNKYLNEMKTGMRKFVLINGPVKPLKEPIQSIYHSDVKGVIQKLSTYELLMTRHTSGFWWDESRPINHTYKITPFAIVVGDQHSVEVVNALDADQLHLDVIHSEFQQVNPSVIGTIWSYFAGMRQYGIQNREEMLKVGTVVSGIGDLVVLENGSKLLVPPIDCPFFVTVRSVPSLINDYKGKKILCGVILLFTGSLTMYYGGCLLARVWRKYQARREKQELKRKLDESRKERRQNVRDEDLPEHLTCVVCRVNPREIILLPCGHFCACEDCNERLGSNCPVCRAHVVQRAAAFL